MVNHGLVAQFVPGGVSQFLCFLVLEMFCVCVCVSFWDFWGWVLGILRRGSIEFRPRGSGFVALNPKP